IVVDDEHGDPVQWSRRSVTHAGHTSAGTKMDCDPSIPTVRAVSTVSASPRTLRSFRLLVERQHALGEDSQILDALLVRGVCRQELWSPAATRELRHLLPQRDGGSRIVAGTRGKLDAHAVGLGLVQPGVRQQERDLADHAYQVGSALSDAERRAD